MKRFWLKGLLLAAVAALPFTMMFLQPQSREPEPLKRLSLTRRLPAMERKAASAEWFMSQRTYGLGYIPPDAEIRAVEDMRQRMIPELAASLKKTAAGQLNWEYHGPGNIGGRLRGLVVHPNNPNIL